jgi:glycosyltransferase involved in cell wall biosynthesis
VRAKRHAFWVDHLAHRRLGTWQAERFAAQLAYDLPVDFIAAAPWVQAELADLRPDARCLLATVGAPTLDQPSERGQTPTQNGGHFGGGLTPLRVAVAGEAHGEREALAAMEEPFEEVPLAAGPDVVLMLSTVDGVLGAPLAGFVAGATAVVGPAHDAADLVEHGENGFVADADDARGAGRLLDRLAKDRELLVRLQAAAKATGEAWPSPEQSAAELEAALERLVAEPPPAAAQWPVRLMGDAIGGAAVLRNELAALTAEVHRAQAGDTRPPVAKLRQRVEGTAVEQPARRAVGLARRAKARLTG